MSYILDALKKAERERDIRQVPTLMAEHEPAAKGWKRGWYIFGGSALGVAAIVWMVLSWQSATNPPTRHLAVEQGLQIAGGMNAQQADPSMPSYKLEAEPASRTGIPVGSTPAPPHAVVPAAPRSFPASATADNAPLRQMARPKAAETRPDDADSRSNPSPETTEKLSAKPPASPPVQTSEEKIESLKEALKSMTLSILLYDENKADRMVFINGRKYVEGDYVEDMYLLESITLDGAYMVYRGERALLRPKAR